MNTNLGINGLHWTPRWRVDNGEDSYVIPFPIIQAFNLVFHGDQPFSYGHYGIHLGQEDTLTFLGPSSQNICGSFIDCRVGSPDLHKRVEFSFSPSSARTLCIPAGVAHTFKGLESVFTLNTYKLSLPRPESWFEQAKIWRAENDVINLPLDVSDEKLPAYSPNTTPAARQFYALMARKQKENIPRLAHDYPLTEEVSLGGDKKVRVALRKIRIDRDAMPEWAPVNGIEGLGWARHLEVRSGDGSGFIPFVECKPMYVVDHGESGYSHDAYGIHLGQKDRLTFVGPKDQAARVTFVDCRKNSPTRGNKAVVEFTPSPRRYLVIPNGVAHRFDRLENIFTINQPFVFKTQGKEYKPGSDVIDWPIDRTDFPELDPHAQPVDDVFYEKQVAEQLRLAAAPPRHSTPVVMLARKPNGDVVRVALRKKTTLA